MTQKRSPQVLTKKYGWCKTFCGFDRERNEAYGLICLFATPSHKSRSRGYAPAANARRGFTRGGDAITRSTQCRSIRDKGGKVKIKGRFIAVLAAVGLLAALLPALPTGAAVGKIALSGGSGVGQYFSDRDGFNVVTIGVTDDDLSPARVGKARYGGTNAGTADIQGTGFDLTESIVGGEKTKVEEFDGGLDNPICDVDGDGDATESNERPVDVDDSGVIDKDERFTGTAGTDTPDDNCDSQGDAFGAGYDDTTDPVTQDTSWTFTLGKTARDKNDDGTLTHADITVVVNGTTLASDNTGFTIIPTDPGVANPGGGITEVTVSTAPRDSDNSVVITYEVTEYTFENITPLRLTGTEIRYGTDLNAVTNQVNVSMAASATATVIATDPVTGSPEAAIVTFVYNVLDSKKDYVSVSTTTSLATGVDRKLKGEETTAETALFQSKVAIVEASDFTQIVNQAANIANDEGSTPAVLGDDPSTEDTVEEDFVVTAAVDDPLPGTNDDKIQIEELNNAGMLGEDVQDRLEALVGSMNAFPSLSVSDPATDLIPFLIPATHSDTLSVNYADDNPSANLVKTATVDLAAPDVTLIRPSHNLFTRDAVVTLTAEVVDAGAGVDQGKIKITASFNTGATTSRAPIQDGYSITNVPDAVGEGKHRWAITVEDKVGNTPIVDDPDTDANEAALGAAGPDTAIGQVDKSFTFSVDNAGPTLLSGETGVYLKNAGVTSGTKQEEEDTNNREWVRVAFSLGEGTAPLDPATVQAGDFTVDDAAPLDVKINSKTHGSQAKGSLVYLKVGELQTNARPTVKLVGEVRDKAGNLRTDGSISSIIDGLAPVLTVTPSAEIANDSVTITVTSSERLGLNPTVGVVDTKPVKDTASSTAPLNVSLQTGALTTWTSTYKNPSGSASRQYVIVYASDQAGNDDTVGDASNDKDFVSFQVDDAPPGLKFKDAEGKDLDDPKNKQQEGAVWIVAEFDDDEHNDSAGKSTDDHRTVEVTAVTLKDSDDNVIASDVSALFGGLETCVDHDGDTVDVGTEEAPETKAVETKCDERTLAINLTPGTYNVAITAVDAAGNSKSDDVDFTVGARKPFGLDLKPGVNLISIPGSPVGDSGNLNILFEDEPVNLVTTYDRTKDVAGENPWLRSTRDPETGLFTGDISTLQPGVAYFVTADASTTVDITVQRQVGELPPTLMVRFGYNALGYWSISPTPTEQPIDDYLNSIPWTVAYSYDPTPGRGWKVIRPGSKQAAADFDGAAADRPDVEMAEPGKGYLVFTRFDATLTP